MAESWVIALITTGGGILTSLVALWAKRKFGKSRSKISRNTLRNHYLFSQIDYWKDEMIPKISFGDPGRNIMIQDFFKIMMVTSKKLIREMISSFNFKKSQEEFHSEIIKLMFKIRDSTDTISIAEGIPNIFTDKFNTWNARTNIFTKGCIDNICKSNYYSNNKDRMYAILNIFMSAYESTIMDGERTLSSLNGELDGLIYKGVPLRRTTIEESEDKNVWQVMMRYSSDGTITKFTHYGEHRLGIVAIRMVGGSLFESLDKESMKKLNRAHNTDMNEFITTLDFKVGSTVTSVKVKISRDDNNDDFVIKSELT